jgi:hypothetical protein
MVALSLFVKKEPLQGAIFCVEVEHPVIDSAGYHNTRRAITVLVLLPSEANGCKGE